MVGSDAAVNLLLTLSEYSLRAHGSSSNLLMESENDQRLATATSQGRRTWDFYRAKDSAGLE